MPPDLCDPADLDRRGLALVAAACGVAFCLVLLVVTTGATSALDPWWAEAASHWRAPVAVRVSKLLAVVGGAPVTTVLRVAGGLWLLWRRRYTAFWAWVAAATLTPLVVEVVKALVARDRPLDFVWSATGAAFPSGHAASAVTNAALVVLLLVPARHRVIAAVCGAVWALAMAASRTVLGAHWLSDVAGGILLGVSVTCAVIAAVLTVGDRRRAAATRERSESRGTHDRNHRGKRLPG